jgi:L-histidine N-alpha-methyltransferase
VNKPPYQIERHLTPQSRAAALRRDVLAGLTATPKSLPPWLLYDAAGSALFDKITELPEYYPTRTERAILAAQAGEIAAASQARVLVELGSGAPDKTQLLLNALHAVGSLRCYVPVDVSESALTGTCQRLLAGYPCLAIRPVQADFGYYLGLPPDAGPQLVAFLGSTIGNMVPSERARFLGRLRASMTGGDMLLLGTDLVKDPAVLVAAYDDGAKVTEAFNLNVLAVLNRELRAGFDLDAFDHTVTWDTRQEWIEMRLRSAWAQTVPVPALGLSVEFAAGEELRTEVSAKFRRDGLEAELAAAGLELRSWWTDPDSRYALSLSVPT